MSGNSFGNIFKIMTFGESHGPALGVIIDGMPPGIEVDAKDIQHDLDRRRPGQSAITTQRRESDTVEILSGIFEGKSTGMPISLLIRNQDARSKDYEKFKDKFRPGHADYTYHVKYGHRDWRGGGRSSGRETAARVAAGAVAKKLLERFSIKVTAYVLAVDGIYAEKIDFNSIEKNPVRCPDPKKAKDMIKAIEAARSDKDSVGGIIEAVIKGCPPGLGEPVFDKLPAKLAHAIMSIGTVKGIEFGVGFAGAKIRASEYNDIFYKEKGRVRTRTNNSGGTLGGITNGEDITLRFAVHPPPTISQAQETLDSDYKKTTIEGKGRHDPCICPRVVPVSEAMIALVLADYLLLEKKLK